jgi:hypothetical protein
MLDKARGREGGLSHSAEEALAARDDAESGLNHANYRIITRDSSMAICSLMTEWLMS